MPNALQGRRSRTDQKERGKTLNCFVTTNQSRRVGKLGSRLASALKRTVSSNNRILVLFSAALTKNGAIFENLLTHESANRRYSPNSSAAASFGPNRAWNP